MVELVVRAVDARQRVTYGAGGSGNGGFGRNVMMRDNGDGRWAGEGVGNGGSRGGGPKYFYLFEDETGILEGIGERRCVTYGTPPVCLLRGEVRKDSEGIPKIFNCTFLKAF